MEITIHLVFQLNRMANSRLSYLQTLRLQCQLYVTLKALGCGNYAATANAKKRHDAFLRIAV